MSEKEYEYICKLCGQVWTTLPEDAIRLTNIGGSGHGRVNTYRFVNGEIHVIKVQSTRSRNDFQKHAPAE